MAELAFRRKIGRARVRQDLVRHLVLVVKVEDVDKCLVLPLPCADPFGPPEARRALASDFALFPVDHPLTWEESGSGRACGEACLTEAHVFYVLL